MARQPLKMTAVGATGSGKSYTSMQYVEKQYSNPKLPGARKTLIFDSNMEYKDVKALAPEDVRNFNKQKNVEIRRILPVDFVEKQILDADEKYQLFHDLIYKHGFRNGLLWLEDPNEFMDDGNMKPMIKLFTTNRHQLMDVFVNYQTFGAIPPRVLSNTDILRIHRTVDSPFQPKFKQGLAGKNEVLRIAHSLVEDKVRENQHFYVYVDMKRLKVTGQFDMDDFVKAAKKYLAISPKKVREFQMMNKLSQDEAYDKLVVELVLLYNGNVKLKSNKK